MVAGQSTIRYAQTICFLSLRSTIISCRKNYSVSVSTEETNSALELCPSSYSAISHSDILEILQMRYAWCFSNPISSF